MGDKIFDCHLFALMLFGVFLPMRVQMFKPQFHSKIILEQNNRVTKYFIVTLVIDAVWRVFAIEGSGVQTSISQEK